MRGHRRPARGRRRRRPALRRPRRRVGRLGAAPRALGAATAFEPARAWPRAGAPVHLGANGGGDACGIPPGSRRPAALTVGTPAVALRSRGERYERALGAAASLEEPYAPRTRSSE